MSHQSGQRRSRGAALPRHIAAAVLTLGSLGILAGCNDANIVVPLANDIGGVDSVAVEPSFARATEVGETIEFSAIPLDNSGQAVEGEAIAWSVADLSVATIDASGTVTAFNEGETLVTATVGDETGSATLSVVFPLDPR